MPPITQNVQRGQQPVGSNPLPSKGTEVTTSRAALIDALVRNALRGVPGDDLQRQALHNRLNGWALRVLGSHLSSGSTPLGDAGSVVHAMKQLLRQQQRDADAGRCVLMKITAYKILGYSHVSAAQAAALHIPAEHACARMLRGMLARAEHAHSHPRMRTFMRLQHTCTHTLIPPKCTHCLHHSSLDDRYARLAATRSISGRAQQAVLAMLLQLSRGAGGGGADLALNTIATYQPPRLIKPVRTATARPDICSVLVVWGYPWCTLRGSV